MEKLKLNKDVKFKTRDQHTKDLRSKFNSSYFASVPKNLTLLNKKSDLYKNSTYSPKNVTQWLQAPVKNEKNLVNLSNYLFNSNSLYKWVIETLSNMATYNWVVSYELADNKRAKSAKQRKYRESLKYVDKLKLENILKDVFETALKEDWYYGYQIESDDYFYLYKFDPKYCQPSSINPDGTYNFALDFSYFDDKTEILSTYPKELQRKYLKYKNSKTKWIEIDTRNSFCIKFNEGFTYTMPYYASLFPSLSDLDFYKDLKKDGAENEVLQLFHQRIPIDEKDFNKFAIDPNLAKEFHSQLANAVSDRAGVVTSPMSINSVETKNSTKDSDYVKQGYRDFYTDAGIPQNLANAEDATSVGLARAITILEQIVFLFYRKIERIINRKLRENFSGDVFNFRLLDITSFSQQEKTEILSKGARDGINIMHYASALGSNPHEFLNNIELENDILDIVNKLNPIKTSHTLSAEDSKAGAPSKGDNVSDSTQTNRDNDTDANKLRT